jgi:hypothetical protein
MHGWSIRVFHIPNEKSIEIGLKALINSFVDNEGKGLPVLFVNRSIVYFVPWT